MAIVEFIIILGVSLDIFAAMECQGALVAKVEKRRLASFCGILAVGQAFALGAGSYISLLLCQNVRGRGEAFLGQVAAAAIFLCQGARLFWKAWRNERIVEHRKEKLDMAEFVRFYVKTSLFTLLTGLAFGFLGSSLELILALITVVTALVTVFGIYTGYRLGFEHKAKAYLAGGILLVAGGMDVVLGHICNF